MSRLYAVPLGALMLAAATAIERMEPLSRVRVDPCAMLVTYLAFRFDVVGGAFSTLLLGLLLDVMSGAPMGLHMLSLMALFVALRLSANAVQLEPGPRLFPVALGAALAHGVLVALLVGLSAGTSSDLEALWEASVPSTLVNALLAPVLLWVTGAVASRVFPETDRLFISR